MGAHRTTVSGDWGAGVLGYGVHKSGCKRIEQALDELFEFTHAGRSREFIPWVEDYCIWGAIPELGV